MNRISDGKELRVTQVLCVGGRHGPWFCAIDFTDGHYPATYEMDGEQYVLSGLAETEIVYDSIRHFGPLYRKVSP